MTTGPGVIEAPRLADSLPAALQRRVHGRRSEGWRIGAAGVSLSPNVGSGEER
jgi:hypothetical protein